jgi:nucleoside-diphosphate-sugar epimerase
VEQIKKNIGTSVEPAFGTLPDRPFEQERPADIAFLSSKLGYTPRVTVEHGLAKTVSWYRGRLTSFVDPKRPH